MKLSGIAIMNFRLLQYARVQLGTTGTTTIPVGSNNSDKTSAIEAILIFLRRPIRRLPTNDFPLGYHDALRKSEQHVLAPPTAAAPARGEAAVAALPPFPDLPVLSLHLRFDYDNTGPDLAIARELLMDLEDTSVSVIVRICFTPVNPEQLAQAYLRGRGDDQSFFGYLVTTLYDHYKLDQFKLSPDDSKAERLPDRGILQRLIRIDVVSAQRYIDSREEGSRATRLSTLLHTHYEHRYKINAPNDFKAPEKTLRDQSIILDPQCVRAFDGLMKGLAKFGHPESPKLTARVELSADGPFKGTTHVHYSAASVTTPSARGPMVAPDQAFELPERYSGLGLKNFTYIVLRLESFREDVESNLEHRPRAHLVVAEGPEVHTYPQAQAVSVQKASEFLTSAASETGMQLLLTAHSLYMAANCGFVPIRHFRRNKGTVKIKDLPPFECSTTTDFEKAVMEFLRKYLAITRCDMFFVDRLVFVEGQVECILLPRLIAALDITLRDKLTPTYVCTIEVGGAHVHLFRKLIEPLQLPVLVVIDLDSIDGTIRKKASVASGHVSSNVTPSQQPSGSSDLPVLMMADEVQKTSERIRVVYQVPEAAGRSYVHNFEEVFVYANAAWLTASKAKILATGGTLAHADVMVLTADAYDVSLSRVNFALDLLANKGWATSMCAREGLEWLAKQ